MNVIKALPPLTIDESELERFAAELDDAIARTEPYGRAMARFAVGMARRSLRRGGRANGAPTERPQPAPTA